MRIASIIVQIEQREEKIQKHSISNCGVLNLL